MQTALHSLQDAPGASTSMRTTVTLDGDVQALLKKAMRERDAPFKQVLNDAIRAGLKPAVRGKAAKPFAFATYDMGELLIKADNLNRLADELEDEELIAKMRRGA